ncbi:MAG: type I-C CRISPR-associated protein Cas5c [Phycisphaeraceae bacterium]
MSQGIQLHVWGDFACFTRPEMKVERVSYDVITPSAARGILEAIYWKPEIRWVVERLHVLKAIRFTSMRRNEVASKIPAGGVRSAMRGIASHLHLVVDEDRQQRAGTILRDVAYVINASFEIVAGDNNPGKHLDQFNRRARAGQCFHRPYLGCREFPADFALVEDPGHPMPQRADDTPRDRDLGYMLHDIEYSPAEAGKGAAYDTIDANSGDKLVATPRFFRAYVDDEGIIDVRRCLEQGGTVQ